MIFYRDHKCQRCGECCRLKAMVGGEKVILNIYCPGLDLESKECMMYEWRQTKWGKKLRGGRECAKVWSGIWRGLYPSTCAYTRWYHPVLDYDEGMLGLVPMDQWSRLLAQTTALRKVVKLAAEYKAAAKMFAENSGSRKEGAENMKKEDYDGIHAEHKDYGRARHEQKDGQQDLS